MLCSINHFSSWRVSGWLRLCAFWLLLTLPLAAMASVGMMVAWLPSSGTNVTGYNIYFGTNSHAYTDMISAGNVTSASIDNLQPGTTYFFGVKAHDDNGNESDFSPETSFAGYSVSPNNSLLRFKTWPAALTNDQVTFSFAGSIPAGAHINPTNGVITWAPGYAAANSTNTFNVLIADLTQPSASTQATLIITVSDYLALMLGSVPVLTGSSASLPLSATASDGITNLQISLNWPGNSLINPTLTFSAPITGGTLQNQGTNLVIQLWTDNGTALTGTNVFAQINFLALNQTSAFLPLTVSSATANKADGATFANVSAQNGEVVVIGVNPLLRPQFNPDQGRVLSIYSTPGNSYEVQSTTNLSAPVTWQSVQTVQATNLLQTISLASADPVIFYRLKQQ